MATRFYLPASGTSPLQTLAVSASWESSGGTFFRAPMATTKAQNSAFMGFSNTFPSTATQDMCFAQWVSAPIEAHDFTTAETWAFVVRTIEGDLTVDANTFLVVRVVSGDGSTDRGAFITTITGGEWPAGTYATCKGEYTAYANVSAQTGDRIVIELGAHGVTPSTAYALTMGFGDPAGIADFPLGAGHTTDLCPWVELSPTLTFVSVSDSVIGSGGVHADASLAGSGSSQDIYVSHIEHLLPGTHYYVRAYATNPSGTDYGDELEFITTSEPGTGTGTVGASASIAGNGVYTLPLATVSGHFSGASGGPIVKIGAQDWTLDPGPFRVTEIQLAGSMPGGHGSASFNVPVANAYLAPHHLLREGAWVVIYDDAHELYEGEIFSVKPSVDSSGQHNLSVTCGGLISVAGKRADVSATWVHRGAEGWVVRPGANQQGAYTFDNGVVRIEVAAGSPVIINGASPLSAVFVLDDGLSDDAISCLERYSAWNVVADGGVNWGWYLYTAPSLNGTYTELTSESGSASENYMLHDTIPDETKVICLSLFASGAYTPGAVHFVQLLPVIYGQGRTTKPRIDEAMVQLATRPGLAVTSYSEPVGMPMDDLRVGNGTAKVTEAGGLDYLAKLYAQPLEWEFGDEKTFVMRPMPIVPDNDSKVIVVGGGNPGLESWEVTEYDEDMPDYVLVLFGNKDDPSLPEGWPRRLYRPNAPPDNADLNIPTLDFSDRILSDASAIGIGDNRLGKGLLLGAGRLPSIPYGATLDVNPTVSRFSAQFNGATAPATTSGWDGLGTLENPDCLVFDGTDDYALYDHPRTQAVVVTVSAWVKVVSAPEVYGTIFSKVSTADFAGYELRVDHDLHIQAWSLSTAPRHESRAVTSVPMLSLSTWHHVAAVYSGGTSGDWTLYIDGSVVAATHSGYLGSIYYFSGEASIGARRPVVIEALGVAANYLHGSIARVSAWDRVLSAAAILTTHVVSATYERNLANGTVVLAGTCKNRKGAPVPAHHVRAGWWLQNTETGSGQPLYITGHSVDLAGKKNALTVGKDWMEEEIGVRMAELLAIPATPPPEDVVDDDPWKYWR